MAEKNTLVLTVMDLTDAAPSDEKYRAAVALDPTLEYEVTGDMALLDDIGDDPDAVTLTWDDARVFTATLLRKISQNVMADFADGDPQKIATMNPADLSEEIQKDPTVAALRSFYDAAFDDPDGPAQDHNVSVGLVEA